LIIKNENTLLAAGMFSLTLSILIGPLNVKCFDFSISDFVRGMLVGFSLALNTAFLIRRRNWRSRKQRNPEDNTLEFVQRSTCVKRVTTQWWGGE
jgi:hypothetical protein